jgi:DNA-binding XRE family transcriptional regulator
MTIRERRERKRFTQGKVAGLMGIQRRHYQKIEAGEVVPSAVLAVRLAQALRCTVEDLFGARAKAA